MKKQEIKFITFYKFYVTELDIIYGIRAIEGCENLSGDECLEVWGDMMRIMRKIGSV